MIEKEQNISEQLLTLLLSLLIWPFSLSWHGFVLMKLWLWFAVPLGAKIFTTWHGVGIICIVRLMTYSLTDSKIDKSKSPMERFGENLLQAAIFPAIILGIGFIAKLIAF